MKNKYEKMVVIFIDILGTKNNTKFKDKYFIHRLFHEEVKANENRKNDNQHVIHDRKIYSFSDCAYIFYFYKDNIEDSRRDDTKLLSVALYNTSLSILKMLKYGYLVRGGVSFGEAYFDELGFFGPAVEEAYKIESKLAKFPRVLLDRECGKQIYNYQESEVDYNKGVFSLIFKKNPQLIIKENDDYYVNIFYQLESAGVLGMEDTSITIEEIKNNVLHKIENDIEIYTKKENNFINKYGTVSVSDKLKWMRNSILKLECALNEEVVGGVISGIVSTPY